MSGEWTVSSIMDLATGYWRAAAVSAAVELDLFAALADGPADAATLAKRTGADPRYLAELLHALAAMRLLTAREGTFAIEPSAAPFLSPESPTSLLAALRFNADLYPLWGRLSDAVRAGRPALPLGAHLGADPARTRRFALGMHSRAAALAPALLHHLPLPEAGEVLDAGAGPGTFTRLLAERHTGLRVTQLDLPPVLAVARELAAESPAASRLSFRDGDYRRDALGGPYDAALYCGALHQEDPPSARNVLARLAGVVRPGGRVVVVDLMVTPDRLDPAFAVLFSLSMMLTSAQAQVYDVETVSRLLTEIGLRDVTAQPVPEIPYHVVSGVVPG